MTARNVLRFAAEFAGLVLGLGGLLGLLAVVSVLIGPNGF